MMAQGRPVEAKRVHWAESDAGCFTGTVMIAPDNRRCYADCSPIKEFLDIAVHWASVRPINRDDSPRCMTRQL
jgi:hypothetical protein